jgi:cell division protein FtsB
MRNFQHQRGWRNIIESKPILIFIGILILFFAWNVFNFWNKMQETVKNRQIVEDKVTQLKQQKEKLESDIKSLNTDEGKEKLFRENFGLAKEGEGVIMIIEDKNQANVIKPVESSGFFSFFRNLFK